MKNKFGILIAIVALLGASYTGVWYYKSNELKESVEIALAERSKDNSSPWKMTYDNVEKAGYPLNIELTFTNPKFLDIESQAQIVHTGNMTFGQSLLDKQKIWVKSNGKTDLIPPKYSVNDGKPDEVHTIFLGNAFLECSNCGEHLQLVNNMLVNTLTFEEWVPILLENSKLELNDFTISQESMDSSGIQQIVKMQNAVFNINNKIQNGNNNFSFEMDVKKFSPIVTPETLDSLGEIFSHTSKEELMTTFYGYGDSNLILQIHGFLPTLDHPFFKTPSLENLSSFSFVIDKAEFINECSSYQSAGKIGFEKQADKTFKGIVTLAQEAKVTELYHTKLVKMGELLAREGKTIKEDQFSFPDVAKVFEEHSNELVPNIHALGTINDSIGLHFHGKEGAISNSIEYIVVELNKYNMTNDLFSLNFDGKLEKKDVNKDSGNLNIQLKHYKNLFNSILSYYSKWQTYLAQAKAREQLPVISTQYIERIEKFLESFSTSTSSGQLDIPIVYQDPIHIKIGPKNMQEAFIAWSQLVMDLNTELQKSNP
ncbi:MAG: hypothetical protein H0U49_00665 [Parachlamydiaceae bacterium]|nr:hypothetical protein [Parachlamydiaceae bacterium]